MWFQISTKDERGHFWPQRRYKEPWNRCMVIQNYHAFSEQSLSDVYLRPRELFALTPGFELWIWKKDIFIFDLSRRAAL